MWFKGQGAVNFSLDTTNRAFPLPVSSKFTFQAAAEYQLRLSTTTPVDNHTGCAPFGPIGDKVFKAGRQTQKNETQPFFSGTVQLFYQGVLISWATCWNDCKQILAILVHFIEIQIFFALNVPLGCPL